MYSVLLIKNKYTYTWWILCNSAITAVVWENLCFCIIYAVSYRDIHVCDSSLIFILYVYSTGTMFLKQTLLWPGGSFTPVLGRPFCGWDNEYCSHSWVQALILWPSKIYHLYSFILFTFTFQFCYNTKSWLLESYRQIMHTIQWLLLDSLLHAKKLI